MANTCLSNSPSAHPQRRRYDGRVHDNRRICRDHYLLDLLISESFPPTRPGQFIQLGCRVPNGSMDLELLEGRELEWTAQQPPKPTQPELCQPLALLRRPFSLAGRIDDPATGQTRLQIIHRLVGVGTAWLGQLKPNDPIDLIGPLGNAFELPPGKSNALLVGGGVGLPPMFYLGQALHAAKWDAVAFIGAMSQDLLAVDWLPSPQIDRTGKPTLCVQQFANLGIPTVVTTNDGSLGLTGLITDGLRRHLDQLSTDQARQTVVYTCGPEKMMHAVATLAAQHEIDCQVCLEQAMACGMGTCQSCVVKIDPAHRHESPQGQTPDGRPWRFKLACTDGPVFDAKVVIW